MDRHDEKLDTRNTAEEETRQGDVLGLGGAAVPKTPGDPTASNDPDAVAKRRARMNEGTEEVSHHDDPDRQRSGATGIDMGAGGQGTHVSGK